MSAPSDKSHRIPEQHCLACGHTLTGIGDMDDSGDFPEPGDPVACLKCGAVCTMGEDGLLRPFTEREARDLQTDPERMKELRQIVGAIHLMRAPVN